MPGDEDGPVGQGPAIDRIYLDGIGSLGTVCRGRPSPCRSDADALRSSATAVSSMLWGIRVHAAYDELGQKPSI
jgi:hypothetical protein